MTKSTGRRRTLKKRSDFFTGNTVWILYCQVYHVGFNYSMKSKISAEAETFDLVSDKPSSVYPAHKLHQQCNA